MISGSSSCPTYLWCNNNVDSMHHATRHTFDHKQTYFLIPFAIAGREDLSFQGEPWNIEISFRFLWLRPPLFMRSRKYRIECSWRFFLKTTLLAERSSPEFRFPNHHLHSSRYHLPFLYVTQVPVLPMWLLQARFGLRFATINHNGMSTGSQVNMRGC